MKTLSLIAMLAVTLCACDKSKPVATTEDYIKIQTELKNSVPVIAVGEQDDMLIKIKETKELKTIANKKKNSKFLSIEMPKQYIENGYCLINIIPFSAMRKIGTPDNTCNYRIFCGSEKDMNYDSVYAVELCGEQ